MRNELLEDLLDSIPQEDIDRIRREMGLLSTAEVVQEPGPLVSCFDDDDMYLRWPAFETAVSYFKLAGWEVMEIIDPDGYRVTYSKIRDFDSNPL